MPFSWFEHSTAALLNHLRPRRQGNPSGLLIGKSIQAPHRDVVLPHKHRCEHAVIVGKTGSGKTHLLEFLAVQLAARREGFALFDFHGDVSLSLISRILDIPGGSDRLVVLDPSHPTLSPGINILEAGGNDVERFRKVSELSSILRQRWGVDSFGARTEELLRNSLYTLAFNHQTLAQLPVLLTDAAFRRSQTDRLEHPDIKAYWKERYEPLSDPMKASFREPLLNRVTAFLTESAARHLLGQSQSTINIDAVIQRQQILIVRLPKGRLREHAHTLGNLLFAQLQFATLAREHLPPHQRHTFTLLCDEVQNLAENDLATLLTEGRKFGISVITANQFWDQLPKELRGALLSAASHVFFRVSSADANVLAGELSLERRHRLALELTTLRRGEAISRFGAQTVVRVNVPPLPKVKPASEGELTASIRGVARERSEVEQSLRSRIETPAYAAPPAERVEEGQHEW